MKQVSNNKQFYAYERLKRRKYAHDTLTNRMMTNVPYQIVSYIDC